MFTVVDIWRPLSFSTAKVGKGGSVLEFTELQCVENIIPGLDVPKFQNIGVQMSLFNKKMLLGFDTGTGKTYTYALFVRALLNRNPEKKHVFVIIHDSLEQAPDDITNLVAVPVCAVSSARGQFASLRNNWARCSVFLLTYQCFDHECMVTFLYSHLPEIESITIDEAHHAANWDVSDTAFTLRALCRFVPYVNGLSATPVTRESSQFYQIMNTLDRDFSPRRGETNFSAYTEHYLPVNRRDYGLKGNYITTPIIVDPLPNQVGNIKGVIFRTIKGTGAYPQAEALVKVVKQRLQQGKSIIVYVHYHDSRRWLEKNLKEAGIDHVSLHGKIINRTERQNILAQFGSGDVRVLLTSVSESLNIEADVVIFYEFTTKLKQVAGRAHRGLAAKELELVFILTKDTMEIDYFLKYIYQRSLLIQKLLGKDYSEFIRVGQTIQRMSITDDTTM